MPQEKERGRTRGKLWKFYWIRSSSMYCSIPIDVIQTLPDTDLYLEGFLRARTRAPCPPME
jgi:hypothetical protein